MLHTGNAIANHFTFRVDGVNHQIDHCTWVKVRIAIGHLQNVAQTLTPHRKRRARRECLPFRCTWNTLALESFDLAVSKLWMNAECFAILHFGFCSCRVPAHFPWARPQWMECPFPTLRDVQLASSWESLKVRRCLKLRRKEWWHVFAQRAARWQMTWSDPAVRWRVFPHFDWQMAHILQLFQHPRSTGLRNLRFPKTAGNQ
jgi:hypothetical protein